MKEVAIIFANLQSHELTRFSLKPGINFILAEDNNVGKSTIFKVLQAVARAPASNGVKIDRLIRTGTDKAYAAFSFDNEKVVAWFLRGNTPGASKVFFEHVDSSGGTSRYVTCPACLLDALGIVLGPNDDVVNFNDADSVQLISRNTVEADAIISRVMQDDRIEHVKQNMYRFSKDLVVDDKDLTARCDTSERLLTTMTYIDSVDEFNERQSVLESLCRVCDAVADISFEHPAVPAENVLHIVGLLTSLCTGLQEYVQVSSRAIHDLPETIRATGDVIGCLRSVDWMKLQPPVTTSADLDRMGQLYRVARQLSIVHGCCDTMQSISRSLQTKERELMELSDTLASMSRDVVCPIKGRVYYTDEKCIPRDT